VNVAVGRKASQNRMKLT